MIYFDKSRNLWFDDQDPNKGTRQEWSFSLNDQGGYDFENPPTKTFESQDEFRKWWSETHGVYTHIALKHNPLRWEIYLDMLKLKDFPDGIAFATSYVSRYEAKMKQELIEKNIADAAIRYEAEMKLSILDKIIDRFETPQ